MDKSTIAIQARRIASKEDLLNLLNQMKRDEMAEAGMDDCFHPFSMKHINYYCNPNNAFHRYKQFYIKKKSGGKRTISAPRHRSFMLMLRYVNEIFASLYTPSDYAMGFAEGRSVVTNADVHRGQNYVFNTDLKDFFPSIEQARVWRRIQLKPLCLQRTAANLLAGLCSMKVKEEGGGARFVLPQGAPTSPILTNMICDKLDRRLAGLARRFGLRYSRYADDITFSSMHNVYQPDSAFRKEMERIITDQGFRMNSEKTRLQKIGARQEVTGIIVSSKLNVTQKYVRDLRNVLYIWDRYGYDTAFNKFFPRYKAEKGHVKKGTPDMVNVLEGKLMYLKMVKGEDDSVYVRLRTKFDMLVQKLLDTSNATVRGVSYVETTPVLEFEKKNDTTIVFKVSEPKEYYVLCKGSEPMRELPPAPYVPHRYASFTLGGRKQRASVNKSLTQEEETRKDLLSISHCRDASGKMFWLIHRSDKVVAPPANLVSIDELNSQLDDLLDL